MSKDNQYINEVMERNHIKTVKGDFVTLHPNGKVEFAFQHKTIVLPALADWSQRQIFISRPVTYSWKLK